MRKTTLLWASVCLLLSGAFRPLDAAPEREDEEDADGTGRPDFCFLDADMGACGLYFKNYFYNHRSGRCEQFVYGGCKGNRNHFKSEAACQHFCGDPVTYSKENSLTHVQPPGRPDYCFLDADMGPCRLYLRNYFYNHRSGRCEQFVYGGCQGNLNNFQTEATCQHFCGD
uniref:BPTI/Kunitz inhibitor domain-containing protein n=1 Tax=Myotis lucifugus TaxID=59463 RepID=G1Q6I2_MYOLU